MRVGILGAGGLGSVIGAGLARSGTDVVLIGRSAQVDAIRRGGLKVEGISGTYVVRDHLEAVADVADILGELDYLILMVKAQATSQALADVDPLVGRVGSVLSFQNTIVKDEALADVFGIEAVIGASTIEGGTLLAPGHVRHTATCPTTAYFGELGGEPSRRVDALVDVFNASGFGSVATRSIEQVEWEKLMQIGAVAGFSVSALAAVPSARFADGISKEQGASHFVALAKDLLKVYCALGYDPQDFYSPFSRFKNLDRQTFEEAVADQVQLGSAMKDAGGGGRASMHEDVLNGRGTEVDYILGPYVTRAAAHSISVPTLSCVYRIVKTIDTLLVGA